MPLVTAYGYDSAGRLSSTTYPDGAVLDAAYDANGQVLELGITPNGGTRQTVIAGITYAPFGPATGWQYGNGRILLRNLNRNYQPEAIWDADVGGLSLRYGFDAVGNLTTLQQADQTTTLAQYGYDGLNRLTQVMDGPTGTPIETYAYDATGNRTALTNAGSTTAYSYPSDSHRLASVGWQNRTYDAGGNTLTIGGNGRRFVYDNSGRMTQVKAGNTVLRQYQYNAKGEQTRAYLDADNAYFVHDEAGHLLGEYDASGTPIQQILWFGDLPVGVLQGSGATQTLHYIEPDHLGTPRVIIDGQRNVPIWEWSLTGEAFGNSPPNQDPDRDGQAFTFDLRFPGQRYDAATGLNNNYFRDYDPSTGRYVESDPIGLRGGASTFGYVFGRPIALLDPTGLSVAGALQSLIDLGLWASGNLNSPDYGPNDAITSDLRQTPMWREIWSKYKSSGCADGMQCSDFQYRQFFGTFSVVGQTVGSFCARFTRTGSKVKVRAYNTWGLESGTRLPALPWGGSNRGNPSVEQMFNGAPLFHWPKSLLENNSTGFGATTRTTYNWTEDAPCCG